MAIKGQGSPDGGALRPHRPPSRCGLDHVRSATGRVCRQPEDAVRPTATRPVADRPREDVESKEAERRVGVLPVERDVLPGDEPVIDVEAQAGVGTGAGAGDVGNADEAVEIGDRVRLTLAGREYVEHLWV